jgi:hypothetical protein
MKARKAGDEYETFRLRLRSLLENRKRQLNPDQKEESFARFMKVYYCPCISRELFFFNA